MHLKKQNLRHSDYATKSIQDLFSKEIMGKSAVKEFNYCRSVVALNNGNGSFTLQPLPLAAQLSSVNAVCSMDVNNDGKADLILGGNMFGFPPQFGRLDGSYGTVLLNDGKGHYSSMDSKASGLSLNGEIKDIKEIKVKDNRYVLIVQNDRQPAMFKIQNDGTKK